MPYFLLLANSASFRKHFKLWGCGGVFLNLRGAVVLCCQSFNHHIARWGVCLELYGKEVSLVVNLMWRRKMLPLFFHDDNTSLRISRVVIGWQSCVIVSPSKRVVGFTWQQQFVEFLSFHPPTMSSHSLRFGYFNRTSVNPFHYVYTHSPKMDLPL